MATGVGFSGVSPCSARSWSSYERLIQHSETLITWAAITLMTRRLTRRGATPSWPRKPAQTSS
jgi:hypothetical protein